MKFTTTLTLPCLKVRVTLPLLIRIYLTGDYIQSLFYHSLYSPYFVPILNSPIDLQFHCQIVVIGA